MRSAVLPRRSGSSSSGSSKIPTHSRPILPQRACHIPKRSLSRHCTQPPELPRATLNLIGQQPRHEPHSRGRDIPCLPRVDSRPIYIQHPTHRSQRQPLRHPLRSKCSAQRLRVPLHLHCFLVLDLYTSRHRVPQRFGFWFLSHSRGGPSHNIYPLGYIVGAWHLSDTSVAHVQIQWGLFHMPQKSDIKPVSPLPHGVQDTIAVEVVPMTHPTFLPS